MRQQDVQCFAGNMSIGILEQGNVIRSRELFEKEVMARTKKLTGVSGQLPSDRAVPKSWVP